MSYPSLSGRRDATWLRQRIIQQSGLALEVGYPLYEYRCSDELFMAIEQLLRDHPTLEPLDNDLCACFCLYAAEWWRRKYAGGPWAWEPILAAAGLAALSVPKREQVVTRGLRRWTRPLLRVGDRTGYLVTLACEGGLPLSLIEREGTRLRRYFQTLLRDLHLFSPRTMPRELAERNAHLLPASFRQPSVFEMAAQLTTVILHLQQLCADVREPIAHLDARRSGWRSEVPLRLDDAVAEALLRNLLADAADVQRQPRPTLIAETVLVQADGEWTIERRLRLPPVARTSDIAAALEMEWDALPRMFELCAEEQDATLTPVALATRSSEGEAGAIRLERYGPAFRRKGDAAAESVRLVARWKGRRLAAALGEGGAALGELPWVFLRGEDAGKWRLGGQGSLSLRQELALLAVPGSASVSAETGGAIRRCGRLVSPARDLYEVQGGASIDLGDGSRCEVKLAQQRDEAAEYRTQGDRPAHVLSRGEVWRGLPRLLEVREGPMIVDVPRGELEWRPRGAGAPWRRVDHRCLGEVEVRYAPQGMQRFRARWTVLPERTEIAVVPKERGKGEIVLRGLGPCDVATLPAAEHHVDAPGDIRLVFAGREEDEQSVLIEIFFRDARRGDIDVPYPSREARFLGRDGRPLPNGAKVWVEQLVGVRAQMLDALPGGTFLVEGMLRARDVDRTRKLEVQEALIEIAPSRHELDLRVLADTLRVLLSASEDLDAVVRLQLQAHGGRPSAPYSIEVARFDAGIVRQGFDVLLDETSRERLRARVDALQLEARPLVDPTAPAVKLAPVEPGRFRLEPPAGATGPWLVTGWEGELCSTRPLCITLGERQPQGTEALASSDDLRLHEAVSLFERRERKVAFRKVVGRLSRDPDDADWMVLDTLLGTLGTLPATTFEVIWQLIDDPDAVALAFLRAGDPVALERMWRGLETLPFLVSLVPVRAWLRAAWRLHRSVDSACKGTNLDTTQTFLATLEPFVRKAPALSPALAVVVDAMALTFLGMPDPASRPLWRAGNSGGQQELRAQIERARQALLREHTATEARSDTWWPHADLPRDAIERALDAARVSVWPSTDGVSYRTSVLHAPVVAACATAFESVQLTIFDRFELIKLRQFAPVWFDDAHAAIAALLLGDHLHRDKNYLDDAHP